MNRAQWTHLLPQIASARCYQAGPDHAHDDRMYAKNYARWRIETNSAIDCWLIASVHRRGRVGWHCGVFLGFPRPGTEVGPG